MSGHVFLVHGDLTRLRCDAWLMPCDRACQLEPYWLADAPDALLQHFARWPQSRKSVYLYAPPEGWERDLARAHPLEGWCGDDGPLPVLVNVGGRRATNPDWYIEGVRQFFALARGLVAARWPEDPARRWRARPLLALPLVGTGKGGARLRKGQIIRALLEALYALTADDEAPDVALVIKDRRAYDATQAHRRALDRERGAALWADLDAPLLAQADALAGHATRGQLALFLGAGVSQGAGLPGWGELLRGLALEANLSAEDARAFARLDYYDQARILEYRLGGHSALRRAIAARLRQRHYSISHGLLAGLGTRELVTMNYDDLMEAALASIGCPAAALPYEPASQQDRWILKMHGCVNHQDEIVLTREDYLRYADRRAALAGLVQGLLITRHMLFVGFSLTDDNFHRIADDVRKALGLDQSALTDPDPEPPMVHARPRGVTQDPFGTALLLERNPLLANIWRRDLHLVAMTDAMPDTDSFRKAARRLEIFLDRVSFQASGNTSYLLDPTYEGLLTPQEEALQGHLRQLQTRLEGLAGFAATETPSPALKEALRFLASLGAPTQG
jgi:hypothetical protein